MKLIIFDINKDIIDACQNIFKNTNVGCIVERVENIDCRKFSWYYVRRHRLGS